MSARGRVDIVVRTSRGKREVNVSSAKAREAFKREVRTARATTAGAPSNLDRDIFVRVGGRDVLVVFVSGGRVNSVQVNRGRSAEIPAGIATDVLVMRADATFSGRRW